MSKSKEAQFTSISQRAWELVDGLSALVAHEPPPVALETYFAPLGVRLMRVIPLLSDAGLSRKEAGLEIFLNSDGPWLKDIPSGSSGVTFFAENRKSLNWSASLRFSIAHELAHAAFLKAAGSDKEALLHLKENQRELERGCHILARRFLMPDRFLTPGMLNGLIGASSIHELIKEFRVSPEVFIRRFHVSDAKGKFSKGNGLFVFAREENGQICIRTSHLWGNRAEERFHTPFVRGKAGDRYGHDRKLSSEYLETDWWLNKWAGDPPEAHALSALKLGNGYDSKLSEALRGSPNGQFDFKFNWDQTRYLSCTISFDRVHESPLGAVVRIDLHGEPLAIDEQLPLSAA